MRYEWTDDKDNVHLLSEKELSLECATYFNNSFYVVHNGTLNKYVEDGSFEEISTPAVFKRIYAISTHFLAVSKDGEVYYLDKSTESFIVQKIVYAGLRQTCEHGVQGIPRVLKVKSICLTETSAVFVCQDGQLWSFNSSVFEAKTEVIYATKVELNKCAYKVRQLVAGRKHCVALVDFASANNQNKLENNVVSECQKCRDYENLRLSTLMEAADEKYATKDDNKEETQSSSEPVTSKPGLDRFFSSFRYPFFKKLSVRSRGPQSRWYAMPQGSSRTFSDTDNSSENGLGGIELSTWHSSQQANSNSLGLNGSVAFSFVSLDNLVSSSDDSSVGHAETDLSTLDQSLLSNNFHSFVSPQVANTFCEVWAWGANDLGQLGAGNAVPTRIPKRVKIPQGPVIKISSGYDHTLALLSTGEVYGWGSNKNGQLKIDSAEFIADPILLKLGSKVCVIDATAGGDVSTVIVNSEDNSNVVACRFSRSHSSSSNGVTSRLDCLEKLGCPLNITAFDGGNKLLVGYLKSDCKKVENAVQTLCKVLLSVRSSCQLSQLAQNIKEKAERELLNNVSGTLWHWSAVLSRVAELLLFSVTVNGSVDLIPSSTCDLTFDAVLKAMLKMHFARIDAVAQGCFHDLNLRDEIKKQVDQLSLEHETESSKDFKRLIGLFAVPQKQFLSLHGVINTILNANKGATFFKKLENDLDRAEKWARLTWQNNEHYPRENGVLLAGFTEEPVCKIKNKNTASPLAIRQFLGRQRTLMMVWSDAVDVIQNEIIVRLAYPLLKIERSIDNLVTISLKDPENFFEVEFQSPEAASEFLEMTAQACEYARLRISHAQGQLQFPQQRLTFETRVRHARYHFSAMHNRFPDCDYDGDWLDGQPHGKGQLKFPDERKYKGRFAYGQIDGMGEFSNNKPQISDNTTGSATPSAQQSSLMNTFFYSQPKCVLDSVRWVKGRFKDGLLHGLGSATFVNGDTYDGYWANGHMHGHGVFKAMGEDNIVVYVGGWQNGLKHGYGVQSTNKERYLGQWNEGRRHGNGSLVTIDGVFHEGVFENDKFVNGRVVYETSYHTWDPEAVVVFEGKFEDLNMAAGKGVLTLNQYNQISGTMHGKILGNELAISNATYKHLTEGFESDEDFIMAEGAKRGKFAVHEEDKWVELFQHFLDDELKVSNEEFLSALNDDVVVPNAVAEKSWNSLAASLAKLKQQKKVTIPDRLERIPDYNMEWSSSYYAMVSEYWNLCVHNDFHPLNRLMRGIIELFSCSYSSVGTHVMYDTAVLEFRTLMSRCYAVTRLLFVNLPSTRDMFTSVPTLPDIHHENTESETSSASSARTPETLSVGSLEQLEMAQALLNDPDQPSTSREYSANDSQTLRSNVEDITLLETPCCDFIINYLFSVCYADLFTVYSERCEALDRRYWERLLHLNAHTDAHLLRYFDVKGELWPTDNDNVRVLDAFTARVSARNKFYGSAVTRLQQISGVFNPTSKLAILAETFSEITQVGLLFLV